MKQSADGQLIDRAAHCGDLQTSAIGRGSAAVAGLGAA